VTVTIDACVWLAALAPAEPGHAASAELLQSLVARRIRVHQPTLFLVEVCATIARRTGDRALAVDTVDTIVGTPLLVLHALDDACAADAAEVAARSALRGADAVYVATSRTANTTLITLDREVLTRASAVTAVMSPTDWLERAPA
jgi:predicted nucleic acid-binding protein